MADYISREEVISLIEKGMVTESSYAAKIFNKVLETLIEMVRIVPAADVVEVKHGNWIGIDDEPCCVFECDICGTKWEDIDGDVPFFCPNCGADMRGET